MDGLETDNPTPGRYARLFNLKADPRELHDLAESASSGPMIEEMKGRLLARFLATHPEAPSLPAGLPVEEKLDWFLRPRDAHYMAKGIRAAKYGIEAENTPI